MSSAIEARGLTKAYVAGVEVVRDLDLDVRHGTVYCLLGRNGAGKTTTIRMLTTLLPPTRGGAVVAGVPIEDVREVRRRIGVALQDVAMDPAMTPGEHLDLALRLAGVPRSQRRGRADALMERFGITDFARRQTGDLSGGMRRRADIALAFAADPEVLFLDEPSSGLDIEGREEVWATVRALRGEGRTVLFTTHDMEEAVALSDEIGIMREGRIGLSGEASALVGGDGEVDLLVSGLPGAEADRLVSALEGSGRGTERRGADLVHRIPSAGIGEVAAAVDRLRGLLPDGGDGVTVHIERRGLREVFLESTR